MTERLTKKEKDTRRMQRSIYMPLWLDTQIEQLKKRVELKKLQQETKELEKKLEEE